MDRILNEKVYLMLLRSQERIWWESDRGKKISLIWWESDRGKKISLIRKGPARRILPLMTDAVV